MFIPYGNSMEYCSGIQVESTTIYSMDSTLCHMDSILFHMDSTLCHMDSTLCHMDSTIFHMDSTWIPHISTLIAKQYLNISPGVIKQILHFVQSTGLGHMTRLNQ